MARPFFAPIVACVIVVISGCSSSGGDAAPDASPGTDAGAAYGTSACRTCVASSCASQIAACSSDPSCAAHLSCVDACPVSSTGSFDPACESNCPVPTGSAGEAAKAALATCRSAAACPACGSGDAGRNHPILDNACTTSSDPDLCVRCMEDHCCELRAKHKASTESTSFRECLIACPSGTAQYECYRKCVDDNRTGAAVFFPFLACSVYYCATKTTCNDTDPNACEKCINANCAVTHVNCYGDPDCFMLTKCMVPCGTDETCMNTCRAAYPKPAVDLLDANITCGATKCKAECG